MLDILVRTLVDTSTIESVSDLLDTLWLAQYVSMGSDASPERESGGPSRGHPKTPAFADQIVPFAPASTLPDVRTEQTTQLKDSAQTDPAYGPVENVAESRRRARTQRVAGVPSLRDRQLLARSLRPMAERKRSTRQFVLDETSTVDHYAETGTLIPQFAPALERFFDAVLLVERSPALPLWRTIIDEFRELLVRQGGLRSLRYMQLAHSKSGVWAYTSNGGRHRLKQLAYGPAPLVLLATDGTSDLWSNRELAQAISTLGTKASVVAVQLLPERLWPNTALGCAELSVTAPYAGALNRSLKVHAPTWLRNPSEYLAMPVVSIQPAPLARWVKMLMARAYAHSPAVMLWLDAAPSDSTTMACAGEPDQFSMTTPRVTSWNPGHAQHEITREESADERIARFRMLANPRVLQTAIYLSATAPLTLAVIRLVQRAMQPNSAPEDLPLLLLGGLLKRCGPVAPADNAFAGVSDDRMFFEFWPGVRERLQQSLIRSQADHVRRVVSAFIAEQVGGNITITAAIEDRYGEIGLPEWAQPFAEVNRKMEDLFGGRPSPIRGHSLPPSPQSAVDQASSTLTSAPSIQPGDVQVAPPSVSGIPDEVGRLSIAPTAMRSHYEVIVVGSGYGGAIAANRLTRAGRDVCVLERGREIHSGEFPSTPLQGAAEVQYNASQSRTGSPLGLFEVHLNGDMNAVVGCGLGGTSLINAGVALRPDPRVWVDPRWPSAIRKDAEGLDVGYARAVAMLQPSPVPYTFPHLLKLNALEMSAKALVMDNRFYRPPITITFTGRKNAVGIEQYGCIGCGDCNSGCNHGAKNSTDVNYLPDAVAHGAHIVTQSAVHSVVRDEAAQKWRVNYQVVDLGRQAYGAPDLFVTADIVILSAGTLGSTAILLRSQQGGMPMSSQLGRHFTSNGDMVAFAFNTDYEINGVGWGSRHVGEIAPVGPATTGLIDHRDTQNLQDGFVIHETSLAGPLGSAVMGMLGIASSIEVVNQPESPGGRKSVFDARIAESIARGPYYGAMLNTQTFIITAHDDGGGLIQIENGHPRIHWPNAGAQPGYEARVGAVQGTVKALGGQYVREPAYSPASNIWPMTVHPLGGCVMAEDATQGVVDHAGRVFSGSAGVAVHDGLYVMDGAVIPMSLGVGPLLTISAIVERNCALLAASRGWTIDYESHGARFPAA